MHVLGDVFGFERKAVYKNDAGTVLHAELTHGNVVAAILQAEAWFTPALKRIGDVSKTSRARWVTRPPVVFETVTALVAEGGRGAYIRARSTGPVRRG